MSEKIKEFFIVWGVILFVNQLFIFGGCFKPYCIAAALPHTGVISAFIFFYLLKTNDEETIETEENETKKSFEDFKNSTDKSNQKKEQAKKEYKNIQQPKTQTKEKIDPLKAKGDAYEKYIGKKFEEKGDLVIYNGFINGYKDKGVDIISISLKTKTINFIQCKNWTRKPMLLDDVKDIYMKLDEFILGYIPLDAKDIQKHLEITKSISTIEDALLIIDDDDLTIRKTLYVSSDKVIDLNIGKHLKMIKQNIFRYRDMKIVINYPKML